MNKLNINPWFEILFHPRKTIREIVNYNPRYRFIALSAIYGIVYLLNFFRFFYIGKELSLFSILLATIIFCIPVGFLFLNFYSFLFYLTGKLIKGNAEYLHVRAALSWSNVLNLANIFLWLMLLMLFQHGIFIYGYQIGNFTFISSIIIKTDLILGLVVGIWSIVIFLQCLSEVQGFSIWKAILNLFLTAILLLFALLFLSWFFSVLFNI